MAAEGIEGQATIQIQAPPEKVYAMLSDVTRMGEWSPECAKAEWIEGATGPVSGARFKGSNKKGILRWSTKPTVKVADPGREFTFEVGRAGKAPRPASISTPTRCSRRCPTISSTTAT